MTGDNMITKLLKWFGASTILVTVIDYRVYKSMLREVTKKDILGKYEMLASRFNKMNITKNDSVVGFPINGKNYAASVIEVTKYYDIMTSKLVEVEIFVDAEVGVAQWSK